MTDGWERVRDRVAARTDRIIEGIQAEWGTDRTGEPFELGPRPFDPDEPPETAGAQLDRIAGVASVVVYYTEAREETVLVFNPGGYWEPPGGVVERDQTPAEAARTEAREEIGVDVALTDVHYTTRCQFQYAAGHSVPLPVVQFVGHRTGGSLHVERERLDHPGVTRATGVFDADVFPEPCRDGDEIRALLASE
ncbi:NUDIX hydrolase [Halovivax limisalsi]|uniref:NUDIX hydrolase n=1 Tax=Halovivax limisalsi TaxID=1453760 RepID=UPI001FFCA854|nr:NUDIX hydrolase [Halovivax limisalsi]